MQPQGLVPTASGPGALLWTQRIPVPQALGHAGVC